MTAIRAPLSGGRLHFQHGPIDLVIAADGDADAIAEAHVAAWARFVPLLDELVAELPALQCAVDAHCTLRGDVARRMWRACAPHAPAFITPMAAVAGAVADTIVAAYRRPGIRRAWVNNGGDIALHLDVGATVSVGLVADIAHDGGSRARIAVDARFAIAHDDAERGIATSGWRGRSLSLGIADSVTVLARSAADADAAATMIANAVDVADARIVRRPASTLKDDSDLGDRLVTVDVQALDESTIGRALDAGLRRADALRAAGVIAACALVCQGIMRTTRHPRAVHRMPAREDRTSPCLEAA